MVRVARMLTLLAALLVASCGRESTDAPASAPGSTTSAATAGAAPSSPGGKIATPLWHHSYAVRAEEIQDQRYGSEGPAGILEPWGYT